MNGSNYLPSHLEDEKAELIGSLFITSAMPEQTIMHAAPNLLPRYYRKPVPVNEIVAAVRGHVTRPPAHGVPSPVLIVDDGALERRVIAEVVRLAGRDAAEVEDGAEAIRQLGVRDFAAVITDLMLPRVQSRVKRVLLVGDDVNVATGLTLVLQEHGITVNAVSTGAEVMPAIDRTAPDLVILDIGLPDIEGTKVYAAISEVHPDLPVVFSTGHGDERKIEPYLKRSNVTMLLKPYTAEALLEAASSLR